MCSIVSVADFSVRVTKLPPMCTEMQLKVHFAAACQQPVAAVYFGYDAEEGIQVK